MHIYHCYTEIVTAFNKIQLKFKLIPILSSSIFESRPTELICQKKTEHQLNSLLNLVISTIRVSQLVMEKKICYHSYWSVEWLQAKLIEN